jgi:putative colanic acid biosynthesis acetyltransferase WcaF
MDFDLITSCIVFEDGLWIGANGIVCAEITAQSHAMLTVGSIATQTLEAYSI